MPKPSSTEPSSDAALPDSRRGLVDAVGQAAERQRLQPHLARARSASRRRAPRRRTAPSSPCRRTGCRSCTVGCSATRQPGVDAQGLARPPVRARGWCRRRARTHSPSPCSRCMMKPSPPNKPDADLLLEGDADRHAARRAQERVLLADQLAAERREVHRQDLAGVRRRERHLLLARRRLFVKTVMNRLSPVSRRLPAPSSAPMMPPSACC